ISARAGRWYDPAVVDALRALHNLEPLEALAAAIPDSDVPSSQLWRNPAVIRFLVSSGISALGDPLTLTAAMAVLYAATRQPLAIAAAYSLQAVAAMLVSLTGGALPDRWRRERLIPALELIRAGILVLLPLGMARTGFGVLF